MKIGRTGLIAKSARRRATRGDTTRVLLKLDERDERREGGLASWDRGLSYVRNRAVQPTFFRSDGWRFSRRISLLKPNSLFSELLIDS